MKRKDEKVNLTNIFLRPRFTCSKCGDRFLFESSMKRTEDGKMVCENCSEQGKNKKDRINH